MTQIARQLTIFDGLEQQVSTPRQQHKKHSMAAFLDYGGFVEKFKPKKTTDDCYTPAPVYNAVLDWVRSRVDIEGREIVRPFYPGGDYENYDYSENCVVVDNPPFSILAKIIRFYQDRGIGFFLFCPAMTGIKDGVTFIASNNQITYENGALVGTAFVSNLFGDIAAMSAPDLHKALKKADREFTKTLKKQLKKKAFPVEVLRATHLNTLASGGVEFVLRRKDCKVVTKVGVCKDTFGNSYLLSERAMNERIAAEKLAAEKLAAEKIQLTDKERAIIKSLG